MHACDIWVLHIVLAVRFAIVLFARLCAVWRYWCGVFSITFQNDNNDLASTIARRFRIYEPRPSLFRDRLVFPFLMAGTPANYRSSLVCSSSLSSAPFRPSVTLHIHILCRGIFCPSPLSFSTVEIYFIMQLAHCFSSFNKHLYMYTGFSCAHAHIHTLRIHNVYVANRLIPINPSFS